MERVACINASDASSVARPELLWTIMYSYHVGTSSLPLPRWVYADSDIIPITVKFPTRRMEDMVELVDEH